jgi:hypothetical protein
MWKTVKDYFRYDINENGEIRKKEGLELNPTIELVRSEDNGYEVISLYGKGFILKTPYVHNLVANTFLDRQPGQTHIIHLDYNLKNNNKDNLKYVTKKEYDEFLQEQLFFVKEELVENKTPIVEELSIVETLPAVEETPVVEELTFTIPN